IIQPEGLSRTRRVHLQLGRNRILHLFSPSTECPRNLVHQRGTMHPLNDRHITESKKAEQTSRRKDAKLAETHRVCDASGEVVAVRRTAQDTTPVMIWMSGADMLRNYFNRPWLEFTGRALEAELGNGWMQALHPEDSQACLDTWILSCDRRESFQMQYRLRRK